VNIPKMVCLKNFFDYNVNYYIGGDLGWRLIDNNRYLFFYGGAGFILTKECLSLLYPLLPNIMDKWTEICMNHDKIYQQNISNDLCRLMMIHSKHIDACDVSIAYFLQLPEINSNLINLPKLFYFCNYRGFTYDPKEPIYTIKPVYTDYIITCHLMTTEDCYDFTKLLIENSYYMFTYFNNSKFYLLYSFTNFINFISKFILG
jgi:hypothetical protein